MRRNKLVQAYAVLLIIFATLTVIIWLHGFVPEKASQDLAWIMLLTFLVALPLAAPFLRSLLGYLRETFKSFQGPGGVGGEFRDPPADVRPRTADVTSLEDSILMVNPQAEDQTAQAYMGIMTSAGTSVIQEVVKIEKQRSEIVFVGLGSGNRWLLPNLYFLALLLQAVTCVREFVFTHQVDGADQVYAGMCPPSRLVERVNVRFPPYAAAAQSIRDPQSDWPRFPEKFFTDLIQQSSNYPEISQTQMWVTVSMLHNQLGIDFEVGEAIEAVGKLTAADWRAAFTSPNRYVPVTENGRVRFVIDQWKWSADVMRAAVTRISK